MTRQDKIAEFNTNGFLIDPIAAIILATTIGMSLMFILILIGGGNPFIGMIGLLGGILLVYGRFSGKAHYYLTEKGLGRNITPFLAKYLKFTSRQQFFPFEQIQINCSVTLWAYLSAQCSQV